MMAARQAGVGLTVVGNGPERANLERLTGDGIELVGWRTDEEIRELVSHRRSATILPGEEDFGIVPVEAQACGRPVVALGRGGALDTVIDGETGVLFGDTTVESLAAGTDARGGASRGTPRASAGTRSAFRARASSRRSSTSSTTR